MDSGNWIDIDLPFAGVTHTDTPYKLWWMATIEGKSYSVEARGVLFHSEPIYRIEERFRDSKIYISIPCTPLPKKEAGCPHLITVIVDGKKHCVECNEEVE